MSVAEDSYYPHFTDGETEAQRLRNLPQVAMFIRGRARI